MNIKTILLSVLILAGIAVGQNRNVQYPANVRYIAGGYSDARPFFSTLNAALNDVKPYATSDNPYVLWLNSDTLQIADWDSVYNDGLSMSDSIYIHYVSAGKIKWAGFDIDTSKGGRGGSSVLNLESMAATTPYFDLARWDSSGLALSIWQQQLTAALLKIDSILNDRTLFSNVSPTYFSISGDSLIFTMPIHIFEPDSFYTDDFDSTTYARTTGNQDIDGTKTFRGTLAFGPAAGPLPGGELLLPSVPSDNPRAIWSDGPWLYYRTGGKTLQVAVIDSTAGQLEEDDIVGWDNLNDALIDSILYLIKQPHIFLTDISGVTTTVDQNIYAKVRPAWTAEEVYRIASVGDSITIASLAGGDYISHLNFVISNATTDDFVLQFRINNVAVDSIKFTGQGATEFAVINITYYFVDLVAGDDISLYITNTANGNDPVFTRMRWYMKREHE